LGREEDEALLCSDFGVCVWVFFGKTKIILKGKRAQDVLRTNTSKSVSKKHHKMPTPIQKAKNLSNHNLSKN
jgi:hypothetical protein